MTDKYFLAFDLETELMRGGYLRPKPICISAAARLPDGKIETELWGNGDPEFEPFITDLLLDTLVDKDRILVLQNAKFDTAVIAKWWPHLHNIIVQLYNEGLIHDTILREKLINLTNTGIISDEATEEEVTDADGYQTLIYKKRRINYALDGLVKRYRHIDISDDKHGDVWRYKYHLLDGLKASQYPVKAAQYPRDDSEHLIPIAEGQEKKRKHIQETQFFDPFETLAYRCALDFHMYMMTCEGVRTNPEKIAEEEAILAKELHHDNMQLLLQNGILRPELKEGIATLKKHVKGCPKHKHPVTEEWLCDCPTEPMRSHVEGCARKRLKEDPTKWACDCPAKTKKGKKEGIRTKIFKEYVFDLWTDNPDMKMRWSDSALKDEEFLKYLKAYDEGEIDVKEFQAMFGESFNEQMAEFNKGLRPAPEVKTFSKGDWKSYISTSKKFLEANSYKDDTLKEYQHRQSLQKLVTTEIPRMKTSSGKISPIIHANYDVLKETGRTSSYASKIYPSFNAQNVHAKMRSCYKAREGHWILAVDYTGLEFVSAAQRTLKAMGRSKYADIINAGWDSHSYLACQWALRNEKWFYDLCKLNKSTSNDDVYHEFMYFKDNPKIIEINGEKKDFFSHYRKSSKPVGLGILGGMGPATIAEVSNTVYKFHMTQEQANQYREVWRAIFPDEAAMLKSIPKRLKDRKHSVKGDDRYVYTTEMGLRRPNCSYTAAANGDMLQSNSAEGATMGCMWISDESYNPTSKSILRHNFKPWGFIHDEICGDVVANRQLATKVSERVVELLITSLRQICPDITPTATAELMLIWSKDAYEVRDENGFMIPYEHGDNAKKFPQFKDLTINNLKEVA
jgi:hypothetical protein